MVSKGSQKEQFLRSRCDLGDRPEPGKRFVLEVGNGEGDIG